MEFNSSSFKTLISNSCTYTNYQSFCNNYNANNMVYFIIHLCIIS